MISRSTARVQRDGYDLIESFGSEYASLHWQQIIRESLNDPERPRFDFVLYSHNLAEGIRAHGVEMILHHWLHRRVSLAQWQRGLVMPDLAETSTFAGSPPSLDLEFDFDAETQKSPVSQ
jgi:hypothetical protein